MSQSVVLVVEDGSGGTATATVRALGQAGHRVVVATARASTPAARSRWCSAMTVVRAPTLDDAGVGFVEDVVDACRVYGVTDVLPCGDAELVTLSAAREQLAAQFPFPSHACVLASLDKVEIARAAAQVGLGAPASADGDQVRASGLDRPWIVKPRSHQLVTGTVRVEAELARGGEAAWQLGQRMRARGAEPLFQQVATGRPVAVVLVIDRDGRTVAAGQQRVLRSWPLPAGTCVRGRSERPDMDLVDRVGALLATWHWWGPAQVEMLVDDRDGTVVVLDVNARPYGTLSLLWTAGLNVPDLWIRLGRNEAVTDVEQPRSGVRFSAVEMDLRAALAGPARLRSLGGAVLAATGSAHPFASLRDPVPAWARAVDVMRLAAKRWRRTADR